MKRKAGVIFLSLSLAVGAAALQAKPTMAAKEDKPLVATFALLLSRASSMLGVNVPSTFNWQMTRNVTLAVQLYKTDGTTKGTVDGSPMLLKFYGDTDGNGTIGSSDPMDEVVYKMKTNTSGYFSETFTIPTSWTKLKVVAFDSTTDPKCKTINLSGGSSESVNITLKASEKPTSEPSV
ncbi:MAG: hypothetical protein ABFR63_05260 [Thermodesulfobacteriota bacterium]